MITCLRTSPCLPRLNILAVSIIMLSCVLAACTVTPDTTLEGRYTTSFEASIFEQCETAVASEGSDGGDEDAEYWLTSTPESGFNDQLRTFEALREPTGQLSVYVRFTGKVSPAKENGYGHLNMYSRQVTVNEILDMKPWADAECKLK